MKEGVFKNGSSNRGDTRDIMIRIEDEHICFYYYENYLRQKEWIEKETERRIEEGEEPLTQDESANHEFYWIDKDHWIKDATERQDRDDNWHTHMERKSWFTSEMKKFINQNTL